MFGAIVALTGPNDFPDSVDLSTPDVLGHTLISLTDPPSINAGELSVELSEGWYALVVARSVDRGAYVRRVRIPLPATERATPAL